MTSVLKLFWNICILRDGPESVPSHTWFVTALIIVDVAWATLINRTFVPDISTLAALGYVVISIATTAMITWFALFVRDLEGRFPATLAALVGCDILLVGMLGASLQLDAVFQSTVTMVLGGVFQIWAIVVWGFIFRRALDSTLTVGILIAFGVTVLSVIIGRVAIGPVG